MLLCGLAMENILKAFVIAQINDYKVTRKAIESKNNWSKKHDIVTMIQNNFIELDSKEMVFEKRLEKYLKWQSKYHLPFNESENTEWHFSENSHALFNTIYNKIHLRVDQNIRENYPKYDNWKDEMEKIASA